MPRRTSTLVKMARAMERQHRASIRAQEKSDREYEKQIQADLRAERKAAKELERQYKSNMRAEQKAFKDLERARKQEENRRKLDYVERRISEIEVKNAELEFEKAALANILNSRFSIEDLLDFENLIATPQIPSFDLKLPGKPRLKKYLPHIPPPVEPSPPTGFDRLLPWKTKKYKESVAYFERAKKNEQSRLDNERSAAKYEEDLAQFKRAEEQHKSHVATLRSDAQKHNEKIQQLRMEFDIGKPEAIVDYLALALDSSGHPDSFPQLEQFKQDFTNADPEAIVDYFALVLDASDYPVGFPHHARLAYVPESQQLVVEYDLPSIDVAPTAKAYKYIKSRDEETQTSLPQSQRKQLYSSVIAQVTLRTVHELFEADRPVFIENIVFNGYVDSIDKSTGQPKRTCLVTVSTTRDQFQSINLALVDPHQCLKGLNASVSPKPEEMAPVRPVIEFDMVDSRFVEETDVLSDIDQRQNLMELSPGEFENLITNLFGKMGLETRQTQASRDGGVDCVAYDPRPIFGGKVVIQAKRYKNTVGVSAVRDLFGTVQNEGASKGILVTTSGYGKASFEFADGKPLELLGGSNLLYLLREHAGVDAKIEAPENWRDPSEVQ